MKPESKVVAYTPSKVDRMRDLQARVQESVHYFTSLKRDKIREQQPGITESELDQIQPLIEEFDPVVELSLMASDRSLEPTIRRQALSEAAQYLRPKLKSTDILDDPETSESMRKRDEIAGRLVDLMENVSRVKADRAENPDPTRDVDPQKDE